MNQREWKPADHGRTAERVGTVIMVVAGGLLLAGALWMALMLWAYSS
ncbi:hypothetical protein [Streptomyces sp. NPDC091371]